ncbi:hypothetical protein C2845_PM05G19450 [Panicum miliaceum]|uniref:Transposase (putative) gypsy type domain-containing protein n=1 Tax=Panicum miliaceum TaxID=4540 RepID=A0A3L6SXH3_PANMI|nr:hypothetical protein C2845_PM05G19450 [Panicum miliaceum]
MRSRIRNRTRWVLHIAGFITLCEAFLRIEPHVGLFRSFFYGKISPAKGETSSAAPVGGCGLQRRPRHDDVYPEYTPAESNKGWHGDWFYIRNPPEAPFPEFHGGRSVLDLSWTWGTQTPEKTLMEAIEDIIQGRVVEAGLNGATLVYTMHERHVMPLAEWMKPLWLYSGLSDPDQAFAEELAEDDVFSWLMMVLKGADLEEFRALAPFDCKNPPNLYGIVVFFCGVLASRGYLARPAPAQYEAIVEAQRVVAELGSRVDVVEREEMIGDGIVQLSQNAP